MHIISHIPTPDHTNLTERIKIIDIKYITPPVAATSVGGDIWLEDGIVESLAGSTEFENLLKLYINKSINNVEKEGNNISLV